IRRLTVGGGSSKDRSRTPPATDGRGNRAARTALGKPWPEENSHGDPRRRRPHWLRSGLRRRRGRQPANTRSREKKKRLGGRGVWQQM
ncbi:unnamed protein product, partial [Citrullus colocynthis]